MAEIVSEVSGLVFPGDSDFMGGIGIWSFPLETMELLSPVEVVFYSFYIPEYVCFGRTSLRLVCGIGQRVLFTIENGQVIHAAILTP